MGWLVCMYSLLSLSRTFATNVKKGKYRPDVPISISFWCQPVQQRNPGSLNLLQAAVLGLGMSRPVVWSTDITQGSPGGGKWGHFDSLGSASTSVWCLTVYVHNCLGFKWLFMLAAGTTGFSRFSTFLQYTVLVLSLWINTDNILSVSKCPTLNWHISTWEPGASPVVCCWPTVVSSTRMRGSLLHGTQPPPGQPWSQPHHLVNCPSSTGTVLRSVSPWPVPGSSPGRSGWLATPAWSKARSMRSLMSSRTSSTPGSNSTLPRTRLVSRTLLMSLFKLLWVNWRRSLRVEEDNTLLATTWAGPTSTYSCTWVTWTRQPTPSIPSWSVCTRELETFLTSRLGLSQDQKPICNLQWQYNAFTLYSIFTFE